jgi:hypothetical protein
VLKLPESTPELTVAVPAESVRNEEVFTMYRLYVPLSGKFVPETEIVVPPLLEPVVGLKLIDGVDVDGDGVGVIVDPPVEPPAVAVGDAEVPPEALPDVLDTDSLCQLKSTVVLVPSTSFCTVAGNWMANTIAWDTLGAQYGPLEPNGTGSPNDGKPPDPPRAP